MLSKISAVIILSALAGSLGLSAASAQQVGQHPAVWAPRTLPAVDVNTFIPGHPASPHTRSGHANHMHPAVAQSLAAPAGVDASRFLVQPPASTQWTVGPVPNVPAVVAAAAPRGATVALVAVRQGD